MIQFACAVLHLSIHLSVKHTRQKRMGIPKLNLNVALVDLFPGDHVIMMGILITHWFLREKSLRHFIDVIFFFLNIKKSRHFWS